MIEELSNATLPALLVFQRAGTLFNEVSLSWVGEGLVEGAGVPYSLRSLWFQGLGLYGLVLSGLEVYMSISFQLLNSPDVRA